MDDLLSTLRQLNHFQLMSAWAFMACYALAVGGMLGPQGSWVAGLAALASAVLFCVLGAQWVHSAIMVMFAVAGMGLFVVTAWALARTTAWFVAHRPQQPAAAPQRVVVLAAPRMPSMRELRALWRSYVGS